MTDEPHTGALIVAMPATDDPVNLLSKEDEAHVTMLWFGSIDTLSDELLEDVRIEVDAAVTTMGAFTAKVSGAAVLGEDKAGVLLLESEDMVLLRNELGSTPAIRAAQMNAEKQFPWWVCHLTMNYDQGLPPEPWPTEIRFDALALWLGEQHTRYPLSETIGLENPGEVYIQEDGFLSSGLIPPIHCVGDIPRALSYAEHHPDSRWYVEKRCVAFGLGDRIPAWSEP
jgi:hypothetical protein